MTKELMRLDVDIGCPRRHGSIGEWYLTEMTATRSLESPGNIQKFLSRRLERRMSFPRSLSLRPIRTYSAQNEDVTNRQQSKGCLELDAERRCKRLAHGKYSNTSAWPTAHEAHRQLVQPYGSCMIYIQRSTHTKSSHSSHYL